jgi:hypothetical protein
MLTRITAIEFSRPTDNGRTFPSHLVCEKAGGDTVEVVAKFSAGCDEGVVNLAREVISVCLAADLGLPVPMPYLIDIPKGFADIVPDAERKVRIKASASVAFGSTLMTRQYSAWNAGWKISDTMLPTAAAIFVFDSIIQNPDRREGNPNCIVRGDDIRIFDHELAFTHAKVLSWKAPWLLGGLKHLETSGNHIFRTQLRGRVIDFGVIQARWRSLSDARISAYGGSVAAEWAVSASAVDGALALIRDARDHIDGCVTEIKRVLK